MITFHSKLAIDLMGKYWSMSPELFEKRVRAKNLNPTKVLSKLVELGHLKVIANNHIQYEKA